MNKFIGGLALIMAAWLIRRALRMDLKPGGEGAQFAPLTPELEAIYLPIALEVEAQVAMLSVSLNDAIEERDSAHPEIAWHLVTLAASSWDRAAEVIAALLDALQKNVAQSGTLVPYRGMVARRFKSQSMIEFLRTHELLDKLLLRSRVRFSHQVHMLRKAACALSKEFHRTYAYAERTDDRPPELWQRLDIYSHDFDLVSKEVLMAFHAYLICLPSSALANFAADLEPVLKRGARTTSTHAQV